MSGTPGTRSSHFSSCTWVHQAVQLWLSAAAKEKTVPHDKVGRLEGQ